MTSFFSAINNPFSNQVGPKIEEATDSTQASENWPLILEVCDLINETEDGPKDAIKAIKKRLQRNAGRNYTTVMYTLTLLEACVKNCDKRFHILVCSKDFVQELIKLIEPKNDPPMVVQEKILSLIQSWADAFHNQPDMSAVVKMYTDLKTKGIEFPMTDLDTMAPIHTPKKSVEKPATPKHTGTVGHIVSVHGDGLVTANETIRLSPEQSVKLRSELDIVQENMTVLNEMLTELVPGQEHPHDLELLNQLHETCKVMQNRLVELISQLAANEVTSELLRINDLLNNLFLRYSRYENNRAATMNDQEVSDQAPSLIDLGPDDVVDTKTLANDFKTLSLKNGANTIHISKPDPDFDMFAQSRTVTYETSKKTGSTYEDNLKPDHKSGGIAAVTLSRSQPPSLDADILGVRTNGDTIEQIICNALIKRLKIDLMTFHRYHQVYELITLCIISLIRRTILLVPFPSCNSLVQSCLNPILNLREQLMHRESDFDEMAAWLQEQGATAEPDSLTSSEFDRFLAERAAAAEDLPSQTISEHSSSFNRTTPSHQNKHTNKNMYAL